MQKINYDQKKKEMEEYLEKMIKTTKTEEKKKEAIIRNQDFLPLYGSALKALISGEKMNWEKVKPISVKNLIDLDDIKKKEKQMSKAKIKELLSKVVVLKLNGGLGTSMGLKIPKSMLEVQQKMNFLEIIIQQLILLNKEYGVSIPLVLMNSFNTDEMIKTYLKETEDKHKDIKIHCFNQKMNPKILESTLLPLASNYEDPTEFNPPGHGDIYDSFVKAGLHKKFLNDGKEYLFLSNVDNLGATIDFSILQYLLDNKKEFCLEVTKKTLNDVKGGTLIETEDGKVKLLELAQVPKENVAEFCSIDKFKVFNTNNMWINLNAISKRLEKIKESEIIFNKKICKGKKIIQLEQACGAAISSFENAMGLEVSRKRFLPVKKCCDLFLIQSELFTMKDDFSFVKMNEKPLPRVIFNGDEFNNVLEYNRRFICGLPKIKNLKKLTLTGDIRFGKDIELNGEIELNVKPEKTMYIPDFTKFN